jgi:hypothetical protein
LVLVALGQPLQKEVMALIQSSAQSLLLVVVLVVVNMFLEVQQHFQTETTVVLVAVVLEPIVGQQFQREDQELLLKEVMAVLGF